MKENMRACSICGALHPVSELTEFDDHYLCPDCLRTETVCCEVCGDRIWTDDNSGDDHLSLCSRCYDRNYTSCVDCGRVIHHNDAYYEDDDDYEARFAISCRIRAVSFLIMLICETCPTRSFMAVSKSWLY